MDLYDMYFDESLGMKVSGLNSDMGEDRLFIKVYVFKDVTGFYGRFKRTTRIPIYPVPS